MDPLTAVGAVASAGQLFDLSLNYSHKAYRFISTFKHSEKHVATLQAQLQEVNGLMRDLQRYDEETRRNPLTRSSRHSRVQYSITEISRQFADDMLCLHRLLPNDMVAFSNSSRQRAKFVLRKEDAESILERLDSRKSAAILALQLIGRFNEISLQDDIASLRKGMQSLLDRTAAWQHPDRIQPDNDLHEASLSDDIQEFRELIAQERTEGAGRQDRRTESLACDIQQIRDQLALMLNRQSETMTLCNTRFTATTNATVSNTNMLSTLVRLELQQQLEPLLDRVDGARDGIDELVSALSFTTPTPNHKQDSAEDISSNSCPDDDPNAPFGLNEFRYRQPHEVLLSSTRQYVETVFGVLVIRLQRYRIRGPRLGTRRAYFRLRILVTPHPWLCSRGVSATYSSGPDRQGYFSLAPSISLSNIIRPEIGVLLSRDDVPGFVRHLEQGQIGIWDTVSSGSGWLSVTLVSNAPRICQWLLRDSGYGKQLLERDDLLSLSSFPIWCLLIAEPDVAAIICSEVKRFSVDDIYDTLQRDVNVRVGWSFFYGTLIHLPCRGRSSQAWSQAVAIAQVLASFGYTIRPFEWIGPCDLLQSIFLLRIYIALGGDPNSQAPNGEPLLLYSLRLAGHGHVNCRKSWDLRTIQDASFVVPCSLLDANDMQKTDPRVELLFTLISAGADVHHFVPSKCCHVDGYTLTDIAGYQGIGDIWSEALRKLGMDSDLVDEEARRRLDIHRKLDGGFRSGVDVETITGPADRSGLRQRQRVQESWGDT